VFLPGKVPNIKVFPIGPREVPARRGQGSIDTTGVFDYLFQKVSVD
jgi:hypothetical protein